MKNRTGVIKYQDYWFVVACQEQPLGCDGDAAATASCPLSHKQSWPDHTDTHLDTCKCMGLRACMTEIRERKSVVVQNLPTLGKKNKIILL